MTANSTTPRFPLSPHLRRIGAGLLTDYGTSTVILIVNFASVPVYLRYLSASQFGIWLALTSFLSVISLADPGLSVYVTKRMSEDSLFGSQRYANEFLSAAQTFQAYLAVALMLVAATVGWLLSLGVGAAVVTEVGPGLLVACIASVMIDVACALNGAIITARMRFVDVYVVNMLRVVLAFGLSAVFLWAGLRVAALALGTLLAAGFANIAMYVRRRQKFPELAVGLTSLGRVREYLRSGNDFVWSFQALRMTQLARVGFLPVLYAVAAGPAALSQFNITARIPQIIPQYISKLAVQFFPYLSSMGGNPEREAGTLFFLFNTVVARLCLFSTVAVLALNGPFVTLWVGSGYRADQVLVLLIVSMMIRESLFGCAGVFLYATGRFGRLPLICGLDLVLSVGCGYLAAQLRNHHLVVVCSVAGSFLSLIFIYGAILHQQGERLRTFIMRQVRIGLRYSLLPTLLTAVVAVALRHALTIDRWYQLAFALLLLGTANLLAREIPLFVLSREKSIRGRLIQAVTPAYSRADGEFA